MAYFCYSDRSVCKALKLIKSSPNGGLFYRNKIMFKKNSPIIFLIITVVGGIWYSVSGDSSVLGRKLNRTDSRCYGVDVPESVKYNKTEFFCSCVHAGGHVSKEENYKYCANRFGK